MRTKLFNHPSVLEEPRVWQIPRQKTEFQTNFPISPRRQKPKSQILGSAFFVAQILSIADFKHWQPFSGKASQVHNNRDGLRTKLQRNGLKKGYSIKLLASVMQLTRRQDVNSGVKSCRCPDKKLETDQTAEIELQRTLGRNGQESSLIYFQTLLSGVSVWNYIFDIS